MVFLLIFRWPRTFRFGRRLNYSSKGGKRNGLQPTGMDPTLFGLPVGTLIYANFNNETIIDYVEIPVLLKLAWGHGLRYFVKAGPHFGYRVKAKTLTSGMSLLYLDEAGTQPIPMVPEQDFTASTDVKSETRSTNYGISGGAGIETAFGPGTIILEALFSYDLNYTQINTAVNGKNHNGAVVISVGYAFSLIK